MATLPGSGAGLSGVEFGGIINEDVMQRIWDISKIPLPATDAIGSGTAKNALTEWTTDELAAPVTGGWIVDGADASGDDTRHGARIGNQCGALEKQVIVTERAQASDTIGYSNALSYQVMMRQRELRRDVEANILGIQGSQADDGDTTPGIPASLPVQMTKFDTGSGGSGGDYSAGGIWSAWTPGAVPVGLTETMLRDALQAAYEDNAEPPIFMSVPGMIRALSEYMFTSSSRIATLTRETQSVGNGGAATAVGSVNVFITDFGQTVTFVPNRIQRTYTAGSTPACAGLLIDGNYAELAFLKGYRTLPMAKTGTSDKRQMVVDFTAKCLNPDAHRALMDLDPAVAVAA